jgi:uncharacterized Rossmann fold enzyme
MATATLDLNQKQEVKYCIPHWLRDEQIRANSARITARISGTPEPRPEPVAVVGYGPSLNDTWEQIKGYEHVITCSGAHKFLVDRGIKPTHHVEVDPREHKVTLIGQPQEGTQYLLASACHPKLLKHLEGYDVRLWHVFDPSDEGWRQLPPGEWAIMGGCDVGLRAIAIAGFLGFRDVHVFGLDGSAREARHADAHPNGGTKFAPVEYGGKTYQTTPAMLEAARQLWHELDQLPKVKATFYGEGLIQAMAKDYVPKPVAEKNLVAISKPAVISAEYRDLNAQLHRDNLFYGVGGGKYAPLVKTLMDKIGTRSVLDYGCGKGYLASTLAQEGIPIWEYDPAVPGKSEAPRPADLVICTDVLEHVEPDHIVAVLLDLKRVTRKVGYFVVHTGPSSKSLPDGRNAHVLQRSRKWWERVLGKFFYVGKVNEKAPLVEFVIGPKGRKEKV